MSTGGAGGEGGERMAMASYGLWNVEVSRKLQKYLFSVVLSKDSIFHSNS